MASKKACLNLAPFGLKIGHEIPPRSSQDAHMTPHEASKTPQDAPKSPQDAQDAPKTAQDGHKTAQDALKTAQDALHTLPRHRDFRKGRVQELHVPPYPFNFGSLSKLGGGVEKHDFGTHLDAMASRTYINIKLNKTVLGNQSYAKMLILEFCCGAPPAT